MFRITIYCLCFLSIPFIALADDSAFWQNVYTRVSAQSVSPISAEKMAVAALKGLNQADKQTQLADDGKRVTLYYKSHVSRSFLKPENAEDAAAWAKLTNKVITLAKKISPAVQHNDFMLNDKLLQAMVTSLDADSKYYPDPSAANEHRKQIVRNYAERMIDNVLYLKILAFNKNTKANIIKSLQEHPQAKGMILDLRQSPGGLLGEAIDITDIFLDEGIVVSTQGRTGTSTRFYMSEPGDAFSGKPIVILVDGNTASAAEVLAASLQEQGRARVIGTKTLGKGSIQNLLNLPDGGALAITSAHFYTPSGHALHHRGVIPDICTSGLADNKNLKRLLEDKNTGDCLPENRETANLEIDAALKVLAPWTKAAEITKD